MRTLVEPEKRESKRERFLDIERCKGAAIFLVVLGHIVARSSLEGHQWYYSLRVGIYQFHMPFFMYLSGFVFFYAGYGTQSLPGYWKFMQARFVRLIVPFLAIAALIIVGKFAAQKFIQVDNLPGRLFESIVAVFWNTGKSPAASVWYVFFLFIYCLAVPPLMALFRGSMGALFFLSVVMYIFPRIPYIYLDRISIYFIFFVTGGLLAKNYQRYFKFIDDYALFLLFASIIFPLVYFDTRAPWALLVAGLISIPAIHGLIRTRFLSRNNFILWLGGYSFIIYLLNTIFIGVSKGVMLTMAPWEGSNFFIFTPILLLSGLFGPIILKKYVLVHFPVADNLTS